ncbi:MAG: hypothetical protein ACXADB_03045 [Candidatus Hermodarchaeia archaeon]|jgi:hypothetical protein
MKKLYKVADKFRKQAKTIDEYIKAKLVEIYKEIGEYPPDDVRVRTTGQAPINVTVWSNSYAPEMRVTIENRLTQHFDPDNEGTYRFEVIFFDPETGQEG